MVFSLILIFGWFLQALYSSDLWVGSGNITKWYNPFDLCMINNKSNRSVDIITANCESQNNGLQPLLPVRCRVGNTWPSKSAYCSSSDIPFAERKNFQRSILGYDDPSSRPLDSFFRKLSAENGALLLIGDSVTQQFYNAIACELEREKVWKDPTKFTNTDELQYVRVTGAMNKVEIKFLPIYHFVNGRWDRVPDAAMHNMKSTLINMMRLHKSLVIVINMGLHYVDNPVQHFSRKDYQLQMTKALSFLHNFAIDNHPVRIFWRETSAQHFPTPNGYWPGARYSNTMKLACVPIQDTSAAADWRNRIIEQIIESKNLFNIKILPFYNITLPLWSEHPNGHLKDCTHFCWTPMMYQSIFHQLDQGMMMTKEGRLIS